MEIHICRNVPVHTRVVKRFLARIPTDLGTLSMLLYCCIVYTAGVYILENSPPPLRGNIRGCHLEQKIRKGEKFKRKGKKGERKKKKGKR
jgi:hypothetical protein